MRLRNATALPALLPPSPLRADLALRLFPSLERKNAAQVNLTGREIYDIVETYRGKKMP